MKQTIFSVVLMTVLVLTVVAMLTVEGRMARENEVDEATAASVEAVLRTLLISRVDAPKTESDMVKQLEQELQHRLDVDRREEQDEQYELSLSITGVDVENGLLSCQVIEQYSHPNGRVGSVIRHVTGIIEQEEPKNRYQVQFYIEYENGKQELYEVYELEEGKTFPDVGIPYVENGTFSGWYEGDRRLNTFPSHVSENATYIAKFV